MRGDNSAAAVFPWLALPLGLFDAAVRCPHCQCHLTDDLKSFDHVVPLARGGAHSIANLVVCCLPCNVRKRDMAIDDWLERCAVPDPRHGSFAGSFFYAGISRARKNPLIAPKKIDFHFRIAKKAAPWRSVIYVHGASQHEIDAATPVHRRAGR